MKLIKLKYMKNNLTKVYNKNHYSNNNNLSNKNKFLNI